jgi:hypothetical protein
MLEVIVIIGANEGDGDLFEIPCHHSESEAWE